MSRKALFTCAGGSFPKTASHGCEGFASIAFVQQLVQHFVQHSASQTTAQSLSKSPPNTAG